MADVNVKNLGTGENALSDASMRVLENLAELEPALVNAAIFSKEGSVLASTTANERWTVFANQLLSELEAASGAENFDSAHVAGQDGEVFAVSEGDLKLVAVTGRFVLASLTVYDMRMALRDVSGGKEANVDRGGTDA